MENSTLTIKGIFQDWQRATQQLGTTATDLCRLAEELAALDLDLARAKEHRYEEIPNPLNGEPTIRSLDSLQQDLVASVASSYDPEGKTKDDRERDLLRHTRATYPDYDAWTDRIERSYQEERRVASQRDATARHFTAVQKRLWAEQAIVEGLNRLIAFCTAQEEALSSASYQEDLLAVERRFTQKMDVVLADMMAKNEERAKLRTVLAQLQDTL